MIGVLCLLGMVGELQPAMAGADVQFSYGDFSQVVQTRRPLLVYPMLLSATNTAGVTTMDRIVRLTGLDGKTTISNMMPGWVRAEFQGIWRVSTNWYQIPDTNGLVLARNCLSTNFLVGGPFPVSAPFWGKSELVAGTLVAFRTNSGRVYIDASGTAGTVTNLLFSSDGMTNQAGYLATSGNSGVAIGYNSSGLQSGVALGYAATANLMGVAIGNEPNADDNGVAIGSSTIAGNYGVAIGNGAAGTISGVAIGNGGFAASYGASIGGNSQASNYGAALGFGATGSDNGVGVGNGTDGSGYGVAIGSGATSGGGAGSVALGGAYGTNTAAVPNGWTNTVELGPGTASLAGGLNFRGYGLMNSNGVFYVNGRPGITTNVLCGSRTLLITNGIVLGVQ